MRKWIRLLPLFLVIWLCRSTCEQFIIQEKKWCLAFDDVLIKVTKKGK